METIEIGAVELEGNPLVDTDEFSSFVPPVEEPVLSEFCTRLTSMRQSQVNKAEDFKTVFPEFLGWIGPSSIKLVSWGAFEIRQLEFDCKRHGIKFPMCLRKNHINLKKAFVEFSGIRPCGMAGAQRMLGIPLSGTHHRAIDNARNIAKIAKLVTTIL